MSEFVVRVEMHHASEANYAELHRRMEKAGYSRFVRGGSGELFQLPTATYDRKISGYATATQIRDEVRTIANTVDRDAWVLVNRYDDSAWCLAVVERAAA